MLRQHNGFINAAFNLLLAESMELTDFRFMPRSPAVQSLERALDLLEAAALSPEGLSLQALTELAELKTTTTFNLARTLVKRGYLQKTVTRPIRYSAGPALRHLAQSLPSQAEPPFHATLRRLAAAFPQWRFIVAESDGPNVFCHYSSEGGAETGHWLPPYISASSLCYHAFWPSDRVAELVAAFSFELYGVGYWQNEKRLKMALQNFRKNGIVVMLDCSPARMAVPLFNRRNELVAALGASHLPKRAPTSRQAGQVADALKAEAAALCQPLDHYHPHSTSARPLTV